MRKSIYILFFLTFNIVFSQSERKEYTTFKTTLFENTQDENHFFNKKENYDLFLKIVKLRIKDIKNNSEGKFGLNDSNKKYFLVNETTTDESIVRKKENVAAVKPSKNLDLNTKKEFIDSIIREKIDEEIQAYMLLNKVLTYGDLNIELYQNYAELKNKLIVSYPILKDIEVQIGKDIYPYLNKVLKTELDKALQNSVNLLVVNF